MNEGAKMWPLSLRLIHWISAALVIAALGLGTTMVWFVDDPAARFGLTQTHKSIGVTVLALTMLRLCLRILTSAPGAEPIALSRPLLQLAAKTAHLFLYVLLVTLPLSGWLMATTTPVRIPTRIFGLFDLPYPLSPDLAVFRFFHAVHVVAAILLAGLVVLHVAAALIHALCWRDRTLRRMGMDRPKRSALVHPPPRRDEGHQADERRLSSSEVSGPSSFSSPRPWALAAAIHPLTRRAREPAPNAFQRGPQVDLLLPTVCERGRECVVPLCPSATPSAIKK
jgi:cytochrome b561